MYRNRTVFVCLLSLAAATAVVATGQQGNLLDKVLDECSFGPGAVECLKSNVLEFLDDGGRKGRAANGMLRDGGADLDAELVRATGEYIERQVFDVNVPGGAATLVVRPEGRAMDDGATDIKPQQQSTTTTTARGLNNILFFVEFLKVVKAVMKFDQALLSLKKSELNLAFIPFVADMEMGMMQDKMLMPLMMMMKMKMKMLMPIMMALVSMKATKALILSKVAVMLVVGFLVKEFLKKSGGIPGLPLHLPGFPAPEPSTTTGHPMYGPPQSSGYESASSWEPSGYSSSHGSDSSHSMAYSSYQPSSSSGSSSSLSATKY